jgi:hypothetical protein
VCVLCVVSLLCCSLVFVCVFYVPCVSRDLCSQSSQSTFCLCIIVSTFSSHRFYCFLINQHFCCCLNKGNRDRVITVTVTALARRQHVVQYQTVTRNQKAARQHRALMTVELVDDIHALVDEAECCRDALLS